MPDLSDSPAARRFLDLATRPLEENAEQCLAARADLARRIEACPATTDKMLEDAAAGLESADRKVRRKWVLLLLGTVALFFFAIVAGTTAYRFIQFRGFVRMVSPLSMGEGNPAINHFAKDMPPAKRLLLFGDAEAGNAADQWKALWESDRSNPAFLQAYAEGCLSAGKEIPADLLGQLEAIDPGNAYLPTLMAGDLAKNSVERKSQHRSARSSPEAPEWIIKDQAGFDQAYEALRKAAELPKFTDHNNVLNQERFRHLPPGRDFIERTSVVTYTAGTITQKAKLLDLAKLFAARAATFDDAGDIAEFRECVRLWRWLVERSADSSWTLIDGLINRAIIQTPLKNFRDAATSLGLDDLSRDFRIFDERMEAEKEMRRKRDKEDPAAYLIETKSSVMANLLMPMTMRQLDTPPVLDEDDFKPGRLVDHALFGQAHAIVAAMCFGLLMLGALLSRAVVPHSSQIVARRLADLVSPREQMLLFVIGILAPVGFYYALIQIPYLSAREWCLKISGFLSPGGQLTALTLLIINLTIALGARLTRMRLSMIVPTRRSWRRWLPWMGVVCSVLSMIACGAFDRELIRVGLWFAIPAACWPLAFWLPRIFRKPEEANLRLVALHQVLAPVWAGAVVVSCFLFALNRSDELKWTKQDWMMAPDAEIRGMTHIEGVVAKQLGKGMRELVKALPQP